MTIQTIEAPWQTMPRGARLRTTPLDIMLDVDEVFMPLMDSIHKMAYDRGWHDNTDGPVWRGWEAYGCSEQAYWDLWSDFALSGGYTNTPPYPGSVEAVRRLYWEGHTLHFVTARGFLANAEKIREWTPLWFEEFAIPYHTLTFSQDKVAAQAHLGVRFDRALDDSPKNFHALVNDGVDAYLMHHHHNANVLTDRRVYSVGQFVDTILEENA